MKIFYISVIVFNNFDVLRIYYVSAHAGTSCLVGP